MLQVGGGEAVYNYRQLGIDQETEEGFSAYRKISEPFMLFQAAQALIALVCRNAFLKTVG